MFLVARDFLIVLSVLFSVLLVFLLETSADDNGVVRREQAMETTHLYRDSQQIQQGEQGALPSY